MTFPETVLPVVVEILVDDVWTDITRVSSLAYVRGLPEFIGITRGRSNEAGQVEASRCGLMLNNRDGRFSPRNPLSPYYGLIDRNTPIRVRLPGSALDIPISGGSASTPDHSSLDITGDIDIRVGADLLDWANGSGTQKLVSKFGLPSDRAYILLVLATGALEFSWSTDGSGTNSVTVESTVPVPTRFGQQAVRVTLDVNNGAGGNTVTFYYSNSIDGTWTQLGDPIVTTGTTSIFNSAQRVDVGGDSDGTEPAVGKIYKVEVRNGIAGTIAANPDFTAQSPGVTSFADSTGKTWTVNSSAQIVHANFRFTGEVPAWPQRWDKTGNDVWVPIAAAGILRRLGQGTKVPTSGLRSTILAKEPYRYWPLDDGVGTNQGIQLGIPDGGFAPAGRFQTRSEGAALADLRKYGTGDFGVDLPPGLEVFDTAGAGRGALHGLGANKISTSMLAVDFVWQAEDRGSFSLFVKQQFSGVDQDEYRVNMSTGDQIVVNNIKYDGDGDETSDTVLGTSAVLPELSDGARHHLRFRRDESGINMDWEVFVDGASVLDGSVSDETVFGTPNVRFEYDLVSGDTSLALGHVAIWSDSQFSGIPDLADMVLAATQYNGETAGRRIERLCDESDIAFTSSGDLDDTVALGPQTEGSLLAALRGAALADGGILFEPRTFLGLHYRTRVDLYNQVAALELDYTDGVFASIPEPIDDDQNTRNDVTVTRESGGSAQAILEAGPLSVQDPPDGVGRYDTDVRVSLTSEGQMENQASWRLHLGTVDEPRFPSLALHLHNQAFVSDAVLTAAAAALDLGDRICVDNMPTWVSHDLVEQMAQGFTERLSNFLWFIDVNGSPYSPFQVAVYGDTVGADPSKYDTAGSELDEALTTTETDVDVLVTIGPLWTTNDDETPFDIECGGERMTVTDIATAVSDVHTFTVVRSVNGVVKTHAAGTPVSLWTKAVYAL